MTTTNDTTTTGDQLLDIPQSDLERLLGVATLIERLDARHQLQHWADFDASQDEEAAKHVLYEVGTDNLYHRGYRYGHLGSELGHHSCHDA